MRSNDHGSLRAVTPTEGPTLSFHFPGLRIGVAEYREGPTGCTVFRFDGRPLCAIDVRGGSALVVGRSGPVDAICLAGGSTYGLAAVTGAAAELLAERHYDAGWEAVARIAGAIIYDFRVRDNAIYPDHALGRLATRSAVPGAFPLGPHGAGSGATVGKLFWKSSRFERSGQGAAAAQIHGVRIAVFTVVNAVGAIVDRQGRVVRGFRDPVSGNRLSLLGQLQQRAGEEPVPPEGNTTLTVVVTDQKLEIFELELFARQVHASLARAIQPFHAREDGDVLFAVATGVIQDSLLPVSLLAAFAGEVAWDAVLSCWGEPVEIAATST
ncbi:MAG: P1 family peptidase [Chloroflexi bacterium]|nr:P1 family peptidase [Chloroflexota bacterium]